MRKPNVLFVPFRFADYPEDLVNSQTATARQLVEGMAMDLVSTHQVVTEEDADRLKREFSAAAFDCVILFIPTWIEPPLAVRAAKSFFGRPLVVWGLTTFQNEDWRVHMGGTAGRASETTSCLPFC